MSDLGRPSDDALWRSVAVTLRDVVLPTVDDPFARASVIRLIGLSVYARRRPSDVTTDRIEILADILDAHRHDAAVAERWPEGTQRDAGSVLAVVSAILSDADGTPVADALLAASIRQLDEDLDTAGPLLEAFRGRVPDA